MKSKQTYRKALPQIRTEAPAGAEEAEIARESMRRIPLSPECEEAEKARMALETQVPQLSEETGEAELVELLLFTQSRDDPEDEKASGPSFPPATIQGDPYGSPLSL